MYPSRFRYESPATLDEAIALLRSGGVDAKVLAGGQSLIPMMKLRFASPALLVDINNIPGLDYHRAEADGTYRIGALCRHADLEKSTTLAADQPTMAAAAPLVADPIVRTRGTFVGSVCHADPQGDWASVMVALDGSIVAQGPGGRRSVKVDEFVAGPFQTVLATDEIAVEAVIPAASGTRAGGYLKLERRVGDFATAGVAVALELSNGSVSKAGIGLTGVGASTINATDAAAALVGSDLGDDAIERAATLAAGVSQPRSDHRGSADYKRHVIATFVTRILDNVRRNQTTAPKAA
ncbi:MAG: xanthine dehydrogenase family protein subunit M [Actinomycetota bacterium]